MSDPAEFVRARLTEDEQIARGAIEDDCGETEGLANQYEWLTGNATRVNSPRFGDALAQLTVTFAVPARILADCAAKRAILDLYEESEFCERTILGEVVLLLASIYADHPDYREEW